MLLIGKPFQAIVSLLLMLTFIGWIPAAVWACMAVSSLNADKRNKLLIKAIRQSN